MAKQFTLGKSERLKSRTGIEQLFTEGKKFSITPFRVHYLLYPSTGTNALLFGTGVSTKNFKKAVDRNRVKRLSREAWRLQKLSLQQLLERENVSMNVFFIYHGKELPVYEDISKAVGNIIVKLQKLIDA